MRILLTGSSGFIGRALLRALRASQGDIAPTVLVRSQPSARLPNVGYWICPALHDRAAWAALPADAVDVVIHCAGLAHVPSNSSMAQRDAMQAVNVELTERIVDMTLQRRAKRFILLSSIAVNGQETPPGRTYRASDTPAPCNAYGESKRDAEYLLRQRCEGTEMAATVIRPPMVYGPGAPGNFDTLLRALHRGLPLPLGAARQNRRSFVSVDNLVDLLITCIDHPAAANQTFLVSDGEDLSTADLLRRLGDAMGKPARLFPVPVPLLRAGAALIGKQGVAQRLLDNLQVDISHTRETLGWTPPITVDEGLRRAVAGLRKP
jgi:nucleoside-diphosphate-sugar epimerase